MSTRDDRRSIEELLQRYEDESSIKDIFVEGAFDAGLITWFLQQHDRDDIGVYPIETVDLPPELLAELGCPGGHRGRVIALATHLEEIGDYRKNVFCLIDKDLDVAFGIKYKLRLLHFTDYACMEMYAFTEEVMGSFLSVIDGLDPKVKAKWIIKSFVPVLHELFLLRVANHSLAEGLKAINFLPCCTLAENGIHFDQPEFLTRYLSASSKLALKEQIEKQVNEYRPKLTGERRNFIQGHDFLDLLYWYLVRQRLNRRIEKFGGMERAVVSSVQIDDLTPERLFSDILKF